MEAQLNNAVSQTRKEAENTIWDMKKMHEDEIKVERTVVYSTLGLTLTIRLYVFQELEAKYHQAVSGVSAEVSPRNPLFCSYNIHMPLYTYKHVGNLDKRAIEGLKMAQQEIEQLKRVRAILLHL
eukprot:986718-Amorphochlora_amoeboformis.AAC.1